MTAAEDAPSNPLNGDLHIYTHNVQNLVDHQRLSGTPVTAAPHNTIFRWNATLSKWIYVIFVELQDGVVQDNHISASMTDNQQRTFRQRVGAVIVTTGSSAPSDPITGDVHIYDEDVTGLSDHYENNGTTARSTQPMRAIYFGMTTSIPSGSWRLKHRKIRVKRIRLTMKILQAIYRTHEKRTSGTK